MIFKYTWEMILAGKKTQTRRLIFEGETSTELKLDDGNTTISQVYNAKANRVKWRRQGHYAVQPGYGEKAIAYIEITNIRREQLQDLTEDDAIAEGIEVSDGGSAIKAYAKLWEEIHGTDAWNKNPLVWVLEFKVTEGY